MLQATNFNLINPVGILSYNLSIASHFTFLVNSWAGKNYPKSGRGKSAEPARITFLVTAPMIRVDAGSR